MPSVWGGDSVWGLGTPWGGSGSSGGGSTPFLPSQQLALPQSTALGTDIICFYDLDPYFSLVTGVSCLAQDLYHSITTQGGALFYDPAYGIDIRMQLNGAVTNQILSNLSAAINYQIQSDDRVQSSTVSLAWSSDTQVLTGNINVIPAVGVPFQFVISATQISVSLLSVNTNLV